MELNHFFKVQSGYVSSIVGLVAWNEVCHLWKTINHHKDGVFVPLSLWQAKDEIHANIFPWEAWNRQGSVKALRESVTLGH